MKNDAKIDQQLRDTLHGTADALTAPDTLKTRVDFALNRTESTPRRHRTWVKRAIAMSAVAVLAVAGAFAGGMGSITSHSWSNQRMDWNETSAHLQNISAKAKIVEGFSSGFTFQYGYDTVGTAENEGKSEDFTELNAVYQKDDVTITLDVNRKFTVFDGITNPVVGKQETTTVDGIDLVYNDTPYLFVPANYQPTEAEKAAEARGEMYISYGSDAVEHKTAQSVSWEQDGVSYIISGFSTGLDAETMFEMASEIIGA